MPFLDAAEIAGWTGGKWENACPTCAIAGVCHDTRRLSRGRLYIALRGPRFDGHDFVRDAAASGACGAVVETNFPISAANPGFPLLRVTNTHAALRAMAQGWLKKQSPLVIGVTGSAGKSTVKDLISAILSVNKRVAASQGNWNNDIGLPLSILEMEAGTEILVLELGTNHPGELAGLCGMARPHWGVVTQVGPSHLEFFGSVEGVAAEKAVLLESLPAEGRAFVRADIEHAGRLVRHVRCPVVRAAMSGEADYVCLRRDKTRMEIEERSTGRRAVMPLPLPGEHQAANLLLAAAVARAAGIGWEDISRGLDGYRPAEMRWQTELVGRITVVNDAYNANPLSMAAAIRTFREMDGISGRKWLAIGDMLELGNQAEAEHAAAGRLVASLGGWAGLVAVGRFAASAADSAVAAPAGPGCGIVIKAGDSVEAAEKLAKLLQPGDAVLVKGSRGMRMERIVAKLREIVSDR